MVGGECAAKQQDFGVEICYACMQFVELARWANFLESHGAQVNVFMMGGKSCLALAS